jgi:hypothetical protein
MTGAADGVGCLLAIAPQSAMMNAVQEELGSVCEVPEAGDSRMPDKLRTRADQDDVIPALQCAFEWVSQDFQVTESDFTLRTLVADAVLECAHEGQFEPSDIRKRAHFIIRSRSH